MEDDKDGEKKDLASNKLLGRFGGDNNGATSDFTSTF